MDWVTLKVRILMFVYDLFLQMRPQLMLGWQKGNITFEWGFGQPSASMDNPLQMGHDLGCSRLGWLQVFQF